MAYGEAMNGNGNFGKVIKPGHDLNSVRNFEEKYVSCADLSELPLFHVTGKVGWINDPNGFSVYKGEYHLFFQYYPYDTKWGLMHWGHVKTRDFILWERLPAALAPDQEYDKDGCFSGSAIEMDDGRHLLMYTGVCHNPLPGGEETVFQTQCLAIGDGIDYVKYEGNPVIDSSQLPKGGDHKNFRDPGIWKDQNGYHAVIGNQNADERGSILLYDSQDALHWDCKGILAASSDKQEKMWECPEYFCLSGKRVLIVSIQGLNTAVCMIGNCDSGNCQSDWKPGMRIDHGTDFYAPQTLETPDGRRIMIAWMQNWETTRCVQEDQRFFGQMTIPRELTIRHDKLIQMPVRELDRYRGTKIQYQDVRITSETSLPGIFGRCLDMTVQIRPDHSTELYETFWIKAAMSEQYCTSIRYCRKTSKLVVDRAHRGGSCNINNVREIPVRNQKGIVKLRIIMDRYSLEVFVNDGEQAASFVIYTPKDAAHISFECNGSLLMDIEKYELKIL